MGDSWVGAPGSQAVPVGCPFLSGVLFPRRRARRLGHPAGRGGGDTRAPKATACSVHTVAGPRSSLSGLPCHRLWHCRLSPGLRPGGPRVPCGGGWAWRAAAGGHPPGGGGPRKSRQRQKKAPRGGGGRESPQRKPRASPPQHCLSSLATAGDLCAQMGWAETAVPSRLEPQPVI